MTARQETLNLGLSFPLESPKRQFVGEHASAIVTEILNLNPGIQKVSWVVYNKIDKSETIDEELFIPQLQPILWVKRENVDKLLNCSREETLSILTGKEITETSLLVPAVTSLVVLDGKLAHIPQMDFRNSALANDLQERVRFFLGSGKWVIVNSGASYHAWGIDSLVTMGEWRNFMEKVKVSGKRHKESDFLVPDIGFIEHSLSRDFSALKIHETPLADMLEESSPQIVGYITSGF